MRCHVLRTAPSAPIPALARSLAAAAAAALVAACCLALPARGAVVVEAAGISEAGNPVAVRATLAISGGELAIDLENVSPLPSSEPADLLTSFYFDIERGGARPALDYRSAGGQVYEVRRKEADKPVVYTPPATAGGSGSFKPGLGTSDLMATKPGDLTWQFRRLDPAFDPLAGFGLGTVGNSGFDPSNFDPKVVGQNEFGIYAGVDIEPKGNLPGRMLARELVRFRFGLVGDWTEADIGHRFTFGLGTGPDSAIVVSVGEPVSGPAALLGATGLAAIVVARRRRQAARRAGQAGSASATRSGPSPDCGSAASASSGPLTCRPISRDTNTAM